MDVNKGAMFRNRFNVGSLYRFFMDRDDIADNQYKRWTEEIGDALETSMNLVNLITEVYQKAIVEDEEDHEEGQEILDVSESLKSVEYKKYIAACSELELVDILLLSRPQRIAFFLNVYQCMYVHFFLKKI